jgi:hypothetical protein
MRWPFATDGYAELLTTYSIALAVFIVLFSRCARVRIRCSVAAYTGSSRISAGEHRAANACGTTIGTNRRQRLICSSGDPSKAKRVLGWEPKTHFHDLVRIMVDADLELLSRRTLREHLGRLR